MILARCLGSDDRADLESGFARMALPSAARDYLLEKIPAMQVLVSGLEKDDTRFLRGLSDRSDVPGREEYPLYVASDGRHRPGVALLSGRREQLERLWPLALAEGRQALGDALGRLLQAPRVPAPLLLGENLLRFGARTLVMGIVNVTPDSFSDGGKAFTFDDALAHASALVDAGADLLDVGGESTQPGAPAVSADEECARVVPVIRALRERFVSVPVSVDTTKAAVAKEALAAGATLVNDISGFTFDPALPAVTAEANAACCLMHIQGTPQTMQAAPAYEDVVGEVLERLEASIRTAEAHGISRERIWVDPGIGFGKTLGHNLELLRRLSEFRALGCALLVGTSRKSFLGTLLGGRPPEGRLLATLASISAMAATGGADVVRVHDVAEAREVLAVADAIRRGARAEAPSGGRSGSPDR